MIHSHKKNKSGILLAIIMSMTTNKIKQFLFLMVLMILASSCGGIGIDAADLIQGGQVFSDEPISIDDEYESDDAYYEDGYDYDVASGIPTYEDDMDVGVGLDLDESVADIPEYTDDAGSEMSDDTVLGEDAADVTGSQPQPASGSQASEEGYDVDPEEESSTDSDLYEQAPETMSLPVTIAKEGEECAPEEEGTTQTISHDIDTENGQKIPMKNTKVDASKFNFNQGNNSSDDDVELRDISEKYARGTKVVECVFNPETGDYTWKTVAIEVMTDEYEIEIKYMDTGEEEALNFEQGGSVLIDQELIETSQETDVCVSIVNKETKQTVVGSSFTLSNSKIASSDSECK